MTKRIRAAMVLLGGLACACAAWAQDTAAADPGVWGVYATLAGQERQQAGEANAYVMRWRWLEPGAQLREEYVVPSSGKLAHYNTITPGPAPGTLHLKASYMGGKEWNGTLDADGTVHWVGKGLFKLRYAVGPGPDGALLYGMEGQEPMRLVQVGGAAPVAASRTATTAATPTVAVPAAGSTLSAEQHAANAAALEAQVRDLRALEASAAAQRRAAEEAGQARLAALQAEVQVKAAAAAEEMETQARLQAQLAAQAAGQGSAPAAGQMAASASVPSGQAPGQAPAQAGPALAAMERAVSTPVAAAPARAPASPTDGFTPGTYLLDGGSYLIEVRRDGDGLLVVEPNKRSPYTWHSGRDFHFYNPNTDTTYGIRVVDARTIEAYKPFVDGNVPSRLTLLSAAASGTPQAHPGDPGHEAIAEKYAAMIESDPDNVQAWAACAGAAMKYGQATRGEADAYAREMIQMLRMMDAQSTPCEDALPSRLW